MAKAKAEDLAAIRPLKNNPACRRCDLQKTSGTVCCPSRGPEAAPIMLVGEALGAGEEEHGRPFVGDAGRKLNYCLGRAKLKRRSLLIGNAVRCRPPKNRKPRKSELVNCWPYLLRDILAGKPKVIVALGATAFEQLQRQPGKKYKLDSHKGRWRGFPIKQTYRYVTPKGKVFEHTCWLVGTFHPSAALSDWVLDDYIIRDLETAKALAAGKTPLTHPDTKVHVAKRLVEAGTLLRARLGNDGHRSPQRQNLVRRLLHERRRELDPSTVAEGSQAVLEAGRACADHRVAYRAARNGEASGAGDQVRCEVSARAARHHRLSRGLRYDERAPLPARESPAQSHLHVSVVFALGQIR
jgi:DNA polymerase